MRILHAHKFFDRTGGAESYLHGLIARQQRRGHEVRVLSTESPRNEPWRGGGAFVPRHDLTRREGIKRDLRKARDFLWNADARQAMDDLLSAFRPDVVHLHNVYHHLSSSILEPVRRHRIRCVQTLHDYKLICPAYSLFAEGAPCDRCRGGRYWNAAVHGCLAGSRAAGALGALETAFTKGARAYESTVEHVLMPSRFLVETVRAWGVEVRAASIVPNPTDVAERPAAGGGGFLLYAGRLAPAKGVETLLRAVAMLPEVRLVVCGMGPEEARLRALAERASMGNVTFLGFVEPHELTQLRRRAEAVVVPSIGAENCPLAVVEALGDGIPVIASAIGGIPELVTDGVEGVLAAPGDVARWRAVLERFASLDEDARRDMGAAALARAGRSHRWDTHLAAVEAIYGVARTPG